MKATPPEVVEEIRALYQGDARTHRADGRFESSGRPTQAEIGARFGLTQSAVGGIVSGRLRGRVYVRRSIAERFADKFIPEPMSGCWLWIGAMRRDGRPLLRGDEQRSKMAMAHRLSYELHVGPIPDGLAVCHRCDTPQCVNPRHLFLGTPTENFEDMRRKGRGKPPPLHRGQAHPFAKLTEDIVRECRRRHEAGESQRALAREFGVAKPTMQHALTGLTWRHVEMP